MRIPSQMENAAYIRLRDSLIPGAEARALDRIIARYGGNTVTARAHGDWSVIFLAEMDRAWRKLHARMEVAA